MSLKPITLVKKPTSFRKKCDRASELTGISVDYYKETGSTGYSAFEDDGTLHVREWEERACFDVGEGQSLSAVKQNDNTRAVMKLLKNSRVGQCLVDETEDDEDESDYRCIHCGRDY